MAFELKGTVLRRYTGPGGDVVIPEGITEIDHWAFHNQHTLTSVTIPDSVTVIGENAFLNCVNLTSVNIPEKTTKICYCAFSGCSKLTTITIPRGIQKINHKAFAYSGLRTIIMPRYVPVMGNGVFEGCKTFAFFYTSGDGFEYGYVGDVDSFPSQSIVVPDCVTAIAECGFCYVDHLQSITLPNHLQSIGCEAFYASGLTAITVPESVREIGSGAFDGTDLTAIHIPARLLPETWESLFGMISKTQIQDLLNHTLDFDEPVMLLFLSALIRTCVDWVDNFSTAKLETIFRYCHEKQVLHPEAMIAGLDIALARGNAELAAFLMEQKNCYFPDETENVFDL